MVAQVGTSRTLALLLLTGLVMGCAASGEAPVAEAEGVETVRVGDASIGIPSGRAVEEHDDPIQYPCTTTVTRRLAIVAHGGLTTGQGGECPEIGVEVATPILAPLDAIPKELVVVPDARWSAVEGATGQEQEFIVNDAQDGSTVVRYVSYPVTLGSAAADVTELRLDEEVTEVRIVSEELNLWLLVTHSDVEPGLADAVIQSIERAA
jgi:hypothetical protein